MATAGGAPAAASEPPLAHVSLGKLKSGVVWWDPDRQVGRRRGGAPLNGADTLKLVSEMARILLGNRASLLCSLNAAHLPRDLQGQ